MNLLTPMHINCRLFLSERVVVDGHGCDTALYLGVKAKENQDKVPTLNWLPKLPKTLYNKSYR